MEYIQEDIDSEGMIVRIINLEENEWKLTEKEYEWSQQIK